VDVTDHSVYLALGSNIGNRQAHLLAALSALPPRVHPVAISSAYETAPAYYADQPAFLNAVCCTRTTLSPPRLLAFLKDLEHDMGRQAGAVRFGPRIIDLDILFYDDLEMQTESLTIPHPRLAERGFVLIPLAEIASALIHPTSGLSVAEMLGKLPEPKGVLNVRRGFAAQAWEAIGNRQAGGRQ